MRASTAKFVECKQSLDSAMTKAGGAVISCTGLEGTTALDLIDLICTNEIEFTFTGVENEVGHD